MIYTIAINTWVLVYVILILLRKLVTIAFGDTLGDFVDVCSLANISVLVIIIMVLM